MTTMTNSGLSLPAPSFVNRPCAHCHSLPIPASKRWRMVVLYALAMAWVEAAVVFYIRSMIDRIEPYQPTPLPIAGGFGLAEIVREAATLVMLFAVGWLAGQTWRTRVAYSLLAFGVWDIGYYLWLLPLTGWPHSLNDWDILFLIPLPWWGPVWSPVSIAVLMLVFGTLVSRYDSNTQPVWPGRLSSASLVAGVMLALFVFMSDALAVVSSGGSTPELRELLPAVFNWQLFTLALSLMTVPVIDVLAQVVTGATSPCRPFDYARWLNHFTQNRENRAEPDWQAPVTLPAKNVPPLLRTLTQFQLGDGGGPCSLIAYDAKRFRSSSPAAEQLVDAWFREEAEHSRLLGRAVERFGGKPITSHWSFSAFCAVRRWGGVRFELQVLLLTEIVSTAYYRVLQRHVDDPAVQAMATLILRDEGGHVSFHCDRLAHAGRAPTGVRGALWQGQFWLCGIAAASVLWISHGPCLRPFGASTREYFGEVRHEIGAFITRLIARCHALEALSATNDSQTNIIATTAAT